MNSAPIVLILTGPCGVGKTTISQRLAQELGMGQISGDEMKEQLFPEVSDITEFPDKLQLLKERVLVESKWLFGQGNSVIVDYVVLGEPYIKQFREAFGSQLMIKVLLPPPSVIYQRDLHRDCWTSGKECIDELFQKFAGLKEFIGPKHYLDNGGESVEQTVQSLKKIIFFQRTSDSLATDSFSQK